MRFRIRKLLLFCLLISLSGLGLPAEFRQADYLRHVKYLAGDALQGRGNGTPGLEKAATYIAKEFRSYGLQPYGDHGSYFQKFVVTTGSRLGPGNKLTIQKGEVSTAAVLNKDFVPFAIGDNTSVSGEVVFAGYGITADEYHYDDYKDVDVTDKIVLVMAHEPRETDPDSPFNGKEPTLLGLDNTKAINAKYRNARALLIVQDPANHKDAPRDLPQNPAGAQVDDLGICAAHISLDFAQRILKTQNRDLLDLQKQIDEKLSPQTFALAGVSISLDLDVARVRKEVRNLIGLLPATDPTASGEAIVIGAHYDHLGRGGRSSMAPQLIGQIHHGADDNASGTAGMLEVARYFSRDRTPRRRALLFIAFAGEEIGLLGSAHWTKQPTWPLEKIAAMINMDMIGRSRDNQVLVSGIGTSPGFPDLVRAAAAEAGLSARTSQSGYGSSDQTEFYIKNIPVLYFFVGLHVDYHRPSDTWDKINTVGATKILHMVANIAGKLESMDPRPLFTKVDEPAKPGGQGGGGGYGAFFGSIPDMTDEVQGVRFSDVRPNSPAAKAGLRAQDILIRFDGNEIKNLDDFTYMLRTHKPGQTVEVVVVRAGQLLTVQVTLEVRR
jgi:aminopeptidase YwaD